MRDHLRAIISGTSARPQLNAVVAVCHALASASLATRRTSSTLVSLHGLNRSDLAYDCIAEISRQDAAGAFVQLNAYFDGLSLGSLSDEEILAHLRRLVVSKVNQGIFRLYNEADPPLGKILRNIKLAVNSLKHFTEIERFGELCLAPSLCDTLEYLPVPDPEEIQRSFLAS